MWTGCPASVLLLLSSIVFNLDISYTVSTRGVSPRKYGPLALLIRSPLDDSVLFSGSSSADDDKILMMCFGCLDDVLDARRDANDDQNLLSLSLLS